MTIAPALRGARRVNRPAAFTVIELMVSIAILSILIMVLVSMVNQTSSVWRYTTSKIEQFREAREGYESMTRRLSQATLNTYWDYEYDKPPTDPTRRPIRYTRQAELRFQTGREIAQAGTAGEWRPTHAMFFFAPMGFVDSANYTVTNNPYRGLDNLLNTWGYFIEYNTDQYLKPPFVKTPDRKRFRLMESMIPSQNVNLYALLADPNWDRERRDWIYGNTGGWSAGSSTLHCLGENIIALIVLPKLSKADIQNWNAAGGKYDDTSLAPSYGYSTYTKWNASSNQGKDQKLNPINQLPPVVQVAMVAIDEASATRMTEEDNQELLKKLHALFKDAKKMQADLYGDPTDDKDESLVEYLIRNRINYRVFTSDVPIRGAKWSTEQIK